MEILKGNYQIKQPEVEEEKKDAVEEYRKKAATIIQVLKVAIARIAFTPNKIPHAVATPLPPLNP